MRTLNLLFLYFLLLTTPLTASLIVGHRGFPALAPENTLPSFKKAVDEGCDFIELDVTLSKDLVPVIIHDDTVGRTSNSPHDLPIKNLTLEELKKLDVGAWYSSDYTNTPIPTLEEVLKLNLGSTGIMIELKEESIEPEVLVQKVASLIKDFYHRGHKQTLIPGSRSAKIVRLLKKEIPFVPVMGISKFHHELEKHLESRADYHSLSFEITDHALVQRLHALGRPVWVWTVNKHPQAEKLKEWGVDALITDNPAALKALNR